jgi:hypothetical protein
VGSAHPKSVGNLIIVFKYSASISLASAREKKNSDNQKPGFVEETGFLKIRDVP